MSHSRSTSRLLIVGVIAAITIVILTFALAPPAELFG